MFNKDEVICIGGGTNCFAVNITSSDAQNFDPCFVSGDPYYHLGPNSPCIDTGIGNYPDETDIDGQPRMLDGDANGTVIVDMGADEYDPNTSNCGKADFNRDRIVNFPDYNLLANAWLTYNSTYNLAYDNTIDYYDLKVFCMDCWLWQMQVGPAMMTQGQGMGEGLLAGDSNEQTLTQSIETSSQQQAEQTAPPPDPEIIEELLNWLDQAWLAGELSDIMTETEYLEFRQAIEGSGE
jgi:hypothetical protein